MKRTLKEHRQLLLLSQNELAEKSGVSLRTIQRIENGTSSGSPFVIRSLCKAMNIGTQELITSRDYLGETIDSQQGGSGDIDITETAYSRCLKFINISTFAVLCFPFLNLVLPSILYLVFKRSLVTKQDRQAALKILSLQILWSFTALIVLVFIPVIDQHITKIGDVMEIPLFVWAYFVLAFLLLIITLNTAHRINRKKDLLPFVPNIL